MVLCRCLYIASIVMVVIVVVVDMLVLYFAKPYLSQCKMDAHLPKRVNGH